MPDTVKPTHKPSICFVAPKAAPLLGNGHGSWGGAEAQQVRIAKELTRRGYRVSFVAYPTSTRACRANGIRLHEVCAPDAGIPVLRAVHPRLTSLYHALHQAKADIYYQRGNGAETGYVAAWCRLHRRRFVFGAASDSNAGRCFDDMPRRHERWLYRLGLSCADAVVAQSESQQRAFLHNHRRAACMIPSAAPAYRAASAMRPHDHPRVLWVGRIHPKKRPKWVLQIADRLPHVHFDVAADCDSTAGADFRQAARTHANVTLHGHVAPDELVRLYDAAHVLLCTSVAEGFPNTFLEAWECRVPTISTVDPDGVIEREQLGGTGPDVAALAEALQKLLDDHETRAACASRARDYVRRVHGVAQVVDAYEALFQKLVSRYTCSRN